MHFWIKISPYRYFSGKNLQYPSHPKTLKPAKTLECAGHKGGLKSHSSPTSAWTQSSQRMTSIGHKHAAKATKTFKSLPNANSPWYPSPVSRFTWKSVSQWRTHHVSLKISDSQWNHGISSDKQSTSSLKIQDLLSVWILSVGSGLRNLWGKLCKSISWGLIWNLNRSKTIILRFLLLN